MAMAKDDEPGWKPATGTNWMTTGQVLMHLTNACCFCCRGFVTGDWGMPECGIDTPDGEMSHDATLPPAEALPTVGNVAEARRALAEDKKMELQMVSDAGEEKLASAKVAAPWEPDSPRLLGQQFPGMVLHLQSRKSQLFYYLKLMGRDVNTFHLWGM